VGKQPWFDNMIAGPMWGKVGTFEKKKKKGKAPWTRSGKKGAMMVLGGGNLGKKKKGENVRHRKQSH